ncbi:DUF4433 domain-containing protein [Dysgonomonas sp. HDW5B]|uniref:DUF4433 domain-containing protein n=1 Tax=Dysgonomonas sp. HDW5B TaxID=2714927 RepID=UPI00140CD25F|nr:DUF4433 domain-containing protein [Dysgonomonas sp. HDW5B]QIK53797.1 DUF4433 domain-containing protein [Dysgonomonas sp. HDW5B]
MFLNSYNENLYIKCLDRLTQGLSKIESILKAIDTDNNFREIDSVIDIYINIFNQEELKEHLKCDIERIYKPLYIGNPPLHTKGNSYWHINIEIVSGELKWLDIIYEFQISRLLKLYKRTFSRIDNFFISLSSEQIRKYQLIISKIKIETDVYLKFVDHREIINKRKKLEDNKLAKIPFGGLFYITHIKNIESILELAILSHNLAHSKGLVSEDISNKEVNERRNRIVASLDGNIHDFAPLYFNPRNPMLYYLCKNRDKKDLILLKINPHILLVDNVAFSDGNAAIKTTHFYNNIDDFNNLNWEVINDEYWAQHYDGKRIRCSEVLVRDEIPLYYITDIYVYNQDPLNRILTLFPNHLGINTDIQPKLYF